MFRVGDGSRRLFLFSVCGLAAALLASSAAGQSLRDGDLLDPMLPSASELDFGVGLQINRPYQAPGDTARVSLFFFNMTRQDADGSFADFGGVGCRWDLFVRDAEGRIVWQPQVPCPLTADGVFAPAGPFPFPGGTFLRYPVDLPLVYRGSETAAPDGAPLPGGAYRLQARHDYHGPMHPDGQLIGIGTDPSAEVPFRIILCDALEGEITPRFLGQGSISGYRYGDSSFRGADLVLRTREEALAFWEAHTSNVEPKPQPPAIDFDQEMVLVSLLGWQSTGGRPSIEIRGVEEASCHISVQVEDDPTPGQLDVITNPWSAVAVPRSLKEVVFQHAVVDTAGSR